MEPKKKTGTLRAMLLAVSAFAMLLAGVFVTTSASATPEASNGCPEDFALAADGTSCFQLAQTQTTTTAYECAEGTLTPSGTHCYLPAKVTPQTRTDVVANVPNTPAPVYTCPAGSTGTGSGASLTCSKTVDASTQEAVIVTANPNTVSCPAGYSGTPVEGGTCSRTVADNTEVPVEVIANPNTYSCPAGYSGTPVAGGTCSRTVSDNVEVPVEVVATPDSYRCPTGYTGTPVAGGTCSRTVSDNVEVPVEVVATPDSYRCPTGYTGSAVQGGTCSRTTSETVTATPTCSASQEIDAAGMCKALSGSFSTVANASLCGSGTSGTFPSSAHADGSAKCFRLFCRRPARLTTPTRPQLRTASACSRTLTPFRLK